jgi:hypothetical protein
MLVPGSQTGLAVCHQSLLIIIDRFYKLSFILIYIMQAIAWQINHTRDSSTPKHNTAGPRAYMPSLGPVIGLTDDAAAGDDKVDAPVALRAS